MSAKFPPILRRGSTGADVERLQDNLSKLGYDLGPNGVDGTFDEYTEKAVMKFQQDRNLTVDGVVGSQTGRTLGAA